jgi:Ca2+-binding RTX toxin-like protein
MRKTNKRALRLETLEDRTAPAVDVMAFTGSSVTLTGTHAVNVLVLGESGGYLTHNLQGVGTGDYADASDVDPSAGVAYLPAAGASVTFRGGVYADTLALGASWAFNAAVNFQGNGGYPGGNTLDASASAAGLAFAVTGGNTGTLTGPGPGVVSLSAIQNWKGGAGGDTFTLAAAGQLTGQISGGGGADTLAYDAAVTYSARVNLISGTATRTGGVNAIENVTGGGGNDVLIGDGNANALSGGAGKDAMTGGGGADALSGGGGNDVLLGGAGADALDGGDGDDLLVSGATVWDADLTALIALTTEWGRTDIGYGLKLDHVRGVSAGLNGAYVLDDAALLGDADADTLAGGGGQDAFWWDGTLDTLTGPAGGEAAFDHDTGA